MLVGKRNRLRVAFHNKPIENSVIGLMVMRPAAGAIGEIHSLSLMTGYDRCSVFATISMANDHSPSQSAKRLLRWFASLPLSPVT